MRRTVLFLVSALVAGCSSIGDRNAVSWSVDDQKVFQDRVDDRLGRAAERNAAALEFLAMMERTQLRPSPVRVDEASLSPELRQPITIGWSGPATEAVRRIAETVGYRFVETGARPATPVLVTLESRSRAAGQVLADIGLMVQNSGTIIVDQRSRLVEYRHGATGALASAPRQSGAGVRRQQPPAGQSAARQAQPGGSERTAAPACPPCPPTATPQVSSGNDNASPSTRQ